MVNALEGIKVVDLSQWAAAPMAARFLGDLGADVIHVEHPTRGDVMRTLHSGGGDASDRSGVNALWENYNRNKKSVTIDISQERGQGILLELVEKADVFLSNLRPYELEKYNLEYDTLSRLYPRLIYGNLTGHGQKGDDKNLPALDRTSYWSRGGIPHRLSQPGMLGPAFTGAFGDNMCGMALACGLITALFARERTGKGQEVYISLFQVGIFQLSWDISGALVSGLDYEDWRVKPPEELVAKAEAALAPLRDFNRNNLPNALSMPYKTKDRREISLSMGARSDRYWSGFCRVIEREDLEHDPMFESFEARAKNVTALMHILDEVFLTKTLDEWKPLLAGLGILFSYNQNYREIIADPQARINDFFVPVDHPTYGRYEVLANPIKLSETPATVRMPAPEFGQHTEEVLLECGYTWEDIAQLKEQGIIA